ncbi:hypothetical protein A6V39_00225 [Candidatus Mycoplasma haematobovis]|uniref:Uncharacterized protein n=1 Tax=Candidatus Mycoplasma haematobovis TaxID=432608 RepID=A0A1A9QEU1_9MOLU|nr:hypothetical protein [Candidatus Mycoplasma haematobovis]OAL10475.1 hypothetical protein A6V39_00225 [Candidatus Mycoplasma haematobovis]
MIGTKPALLSFAGVATVVGGGTGVYLLSQDKTTIRDKLDKENIELINNVDEYEIAFKEFKDTTNYINLIKGDNDPLNASSTQKDGGLALKKWCESNLKLRLTTPNSETITENIKKYCSSSLLTIEAKLKRGNKSLVENWNDKLSKLKTPSDNGALLTDLKKIKKDLESLEVQDVHKVLENWCKKQIKTRLTEDKNDAVWTKVNNRCLKQEID